MLVLCRHLGEKIVFPTLGVTIQVVSIKSSAVRIGIEAPPDVSIVREELMDQRRVSNGAGQASLAPCSA